MVAGAATGIHLFLLVVDAAEGARPQTLEHLGILRPPSASTDGVVAVTKADAVDAETLELALDEARELVPAPRRSRRARRRAPGSTSSARRRRGGRPSDGLRLEPPSPTRLHVDRSFSLHGIGTVVTGTPELGRSARATRCGSSPPGATCAFAACVSTTVRSSAPSAASRPRASRGRARRVRPGDVLVEPGRFRRTYRGDSCWRSSSRPRTASR